MQVKAWSWVLGLLLCACGTGGSPAASPEATTAEDDAEREALPASAEPAPASGSESYAPPPDSPAAQSHSSAGEGSAGPQRRVTVAEDAFEGADIESLEEESAAGKRAERAPQDAAKSGAMPSDVAPEVLTQRLVQGQAQLDAALSLSEPDCTAALRFRQLVCSLADRICSISDGVDVPQVSRCRDGRRRCVQSEKTYAERCE